MRLCTFPNCAYLSETSRMIEIYKDLKSRGVEVIMATHGGPYEWLFEENGINCHIVQPHFDNQRARDYVLTNTGEKGIAEFYTEEELTEHVRSEMTFFEANDVTGVITGFTLSLGISARAYKIPYYVTHLGSFVPPVFEKNMLVPTLVLNLKIFKIIPRAWLIAMVNNMMFKSGIATKSFNKVAKKFGVESFKSMEEMMMGDTVIVTDVPEILGIPKEEMEQWQPSEKHQKYYNHKSQLYYGGAIYAKLFGEVSGEVTGFLDTDLPKIYIALTSGQSEVIERVYEGIKSMNAKIVILSTVHKIKETTHDNILVVDHLPSHKVMPLMDLAIIHGGQGSIQTAIASGTPVIVDTVLNPQQSAINAQQALQIAALLERDSSHPLATAFSNIACKTDGVTDLGVYENGVTGIVNGNRYRLGNAGFSNAQMIH